ncbi:AmmeMemoRadiSam system protein A [Pseudobutyrivibrio ruminis]|uniref:AmmeMemoRadiSam system protein A n=1 Tax=Pseudobutyrivibrio ruminis TaxID=46206 RepID=UPI00051B1AC0|nr:AmmeMemoRadiSam system protein A [Pseudobutyrivibrio ruminis]
MAILAAFMVPHPPMIVPAVGRGGEAQVQETIDAYEKVADEIAKLEPDTIIITSPHSIMYSDYFHISPGKGAKGSFARFNAPEVSFQEEYDTELVDRINEIAYDASFPAGTLGERDPELDHGTMVPLWFIRKKYAKGQIVRIGLSGLGLLDHYRLGQMIQEAVDEVNRKVVFVASGDLSHKLQDYGPYGFAKEGPVYDQRIMDVAGRAAFEEMFDFKEDFCEKAAECGHRSFVIMAGALDGKAVDANVYSHQDVTGVGYGIATFYVTGEDENRRFRDTYLAKLNAHLQESQKPTDEYVKLAKASLESYILRGKVLDLPDDLPKELLSKQAGAFVSIHKAGRLRGCIGTILPTTECVAAEIIQNAISASTRDTRFNPISPEELPDLEINVDVLSEPEPISSPEELDVKRYGVIVSSGNRRGLLLPDLDGVDSVAQQISIARQKGGIGMDEPVQLQRFEVIRHK